MFSTAFPLPRGVHLIVRVTLYNSGSNSMHKFGIVVAPRKEPAVESQPFFLGWDDQKKICIFPPRHTLGNEHRVIFELVGVEAWNKRPREYPVLLEVSRSGLRFVVRTADYAHHHPEHFLIWRCRDGRWVCLEQWSPNQGRHERFVRDEVHCGNCGLQELHEIVSPQVRRFARLWNPQSIATA